ncbi:MAG: hypothetical protein ACRDTC_05130, partial [Pseudonocardiaceae bacterium]
MAGLGDIARDIGGGIVRGAREVVEGAGHVAREVAGVLDIGEPSGDDHRSSNWAAWGHEEIRSMLDNSVEPGQIHDAAQLWREQFQKDVEIFTNLTSNLNVIISNGWGGLSGEKAIGALGPVKDWSATFAEAAERTSQLMEHSGSSAGQAKAAVPPAIHHDLRQSLTSFATGGAPGAFADAIAQDHAQEEARREAVRIMTNVYSAPINDNRAAVPVYPQPLDPTLTPPEPSPTGGPTPGAGLPRDGSGIPGGGGGVPGGGAPYQPPAAAGLQSAGAGTVDGSQFGLPTGPPQTGGGQIHGSPGYPGHGGGGQGLGAAAAAMPFMPPMAGGDEQERARRGFRGAGPPGGRASGVGGHPGSGGYAGSGRGGGDFGPRGSNPSPAAAVGEGRAGVGGGGAGGRGGGGAPGGVPVGG